MEITFEAKGLNVDPWLREYASTAVMFAVWQGQLELLQVEVQLEQAFDGNSSGVRCRLRAQGRNGDEVTSSATATDEFDAIRDAAYLLELAFDFPRRTAALPTLEILAQERLVA